MSDFLDTLDEQLHEWQVIGLTPSVLQSARELLADHAGQHGEVALITGLAGQAVAAP